MTPAEARHATLYLDLANRAAGDVQTLSHWLGSIRRAWRLAEGDDAMTLEFLWAMDDFFRLQGMRREFLEWANRAAGAAERLNDLRAEGILYINMGWVHAELGETETAVSFYQRALKIHEARGDPQEQASAVHNLGLILMERIGDPHAARGHFERALALAREGSDWKGEAKVLSSLASLEEEAGNCVTAQEFLDRALEIYTRHDDREGQATTLNYRGMLLDGLGRGDEARASYERSLALREEVGDLTGIAATLDNLGVLELQDENYERSREYFLRALEITERTGDFAGMHAVLDNLGFLYDDRGEPGQALRYFRRALEAADVMGSRVHRASTLTSMALCEAAVGETGRAVASLEEALAIHEESGDLSWQAATLHNLGVVARQHLGSPRRAIEMYGKALEIRRRTGARFAARNTLSAMANAYEDLGDLGETERVLVELVTADQELDELQLEHDRARLERIRQARREQP